MVPNDNCRDGATCVGCLEDKCPSNTAGISKNDFCMICGCDVLYAAPCVRLTCGHVFHKACCEEKIAKKCGIYHSFCARFCSQLVVSALYMIIRRWVGARITFGFIACPGCKQDMRHPLLAGTIAPYLALRDDVLAKVRARVALQLLSAAPHLTLSCSSAGSSACSSRVRRRNSRTGPRHAMKRSCRHVQCSNATDSLCLPGGAYAQKPEEFFFRKFA
jgi:hypothetical protein